MQFLLAHRTTAAWTASLVVWLTAASTFGADPISVQLRYRTADGDRGTLVRWRDEEWNAAETAFIICDMWDAHHCYRAVQRVKELAGPIDELAGQLRSLGALVIHAPSSCTEAYRDHPARQRARNAPPAGNLPPEIGHGCDRIPAEEEWLYPLDQSDGGSDDDPQSERRWHATLLARGRNPRSPWLRQIDAIRIDDRDALSDSGAEIWNLLQQRGIRNVLIAGVHTNMCVLGRPFGLRQLARNGIHVALVRDLTDTMYNPARWPFVSHFTGTDRIVEHIETCVCPTVDSGQWTGRAPFRFQDDRRSVVALVVSEIEYDTCRTLPAFAARYLGTDFSIRSTLNHDIDNHELAGLEEVLQGADVLLLSMWRRTLPAPQVAAIRDFIQSGKSVVAIRTSSHALVPRPPAIAGPGQEIWPDFDQQVLGARYMQHHGNKAEDGGPRTFVRCLDTKLKHPLLTGLASEEFVVPSWLYKFDTIKDLVDPVMMGRVEGRTPEEPVAWTNQSPAKGRVFYTSLGHPRDFHDPRFQRLLFNAMYWATDRPVPDLFSDAGLDLSHQPARDRSRASRFQDNLRAARHQTVVTYGTSLTEDGAWVEQLRAAFDAQFPRLVSVINSGQGAMWSGWGIDHLERRVLDKNPDVVIIEFSINDAYREYKTSVSKARGNLEQMIDRIQHAHPLAEIVLMTMNPPTGIHLDARPDIVNHYQMYRDVAAERQLPLIDHHPRWEKLLQTDRPTFDRYVPDGLHPEAEGCQAIITPAILEAMLPRKEGS